MTTTPAAATAATVLDAMLIGINRRINAIDDTFCSRDHMPDYVLGQRVELNTFRTTIYHAMEILAGHSADSKLAYDAYGAAE